MTKKFLKFFKVIKLNTYFNLPVVNAVERTDLAFFHSSSASVVKNLSNGSIFSNPKVFFEKNKNSLAKITNKHMNKVA